MSESLSSSPLPYPAKHYEILVPLLCCPLILFHNLNWHSYTTPAYRLSKYGDPAALPAQGSVPKVLLFFHSGGQRKKRQELPESHILQARCKLRKMQRQASMQVIPQVCRAHE